MQGNTRAQRVAKNVIFFFQEHGFESHIFYLEKHTGKALHMFASFSLLPPFGREKTKLGLG